MSISFRFKRLREARLKKKLTQEDLAECCSSSERYIRDLENGKKGNPSAKIVYQLSSTLNVPMEELMEKEQEETE